MFRMHKPSNSSCKDGPGPWEDIYLFWAMLGLRCCASSSLVAMLGLLVAVASLVAEHGLWGCAGFRSCGVWAP